MNTKTCSKCGQEKHVEFFSNASKNQCKQCRAAYEAAWREDNREKMRLYRKAYRERNPDKVANQQRNWALKNVKKKSAYTKKWVANNLATARAGQKRRSKNFFFRISKSLTDHYIKMILVNHSNLKFSDIPTGLIEVKRLHLQSIRANKQLTELIKEKLNGS